MAKHLHMEARKFQDIIIIGQIQNEVRELLKLEESHALAILAQLYYLFLGIQKSRKHLISLDMVEYNIKNTTIFLVVTITGF